MSEELPSVPSKLNSNRDLATPTHPLRPTSHRSRRFRGIGTRKGFATSREINDMNAALFPTSRRHSVFATASFAVLVSCAGGAPTEPSPGLVEQSRPQATSSGAAVSTTPEPALVAAPTTTTTEPAPPPPTCPANMVLVEGDYCTEVEHKCIKEWWAEANKKRVCEVFEPTAKCTGSREKKRYCIDKYEWPNVAGERPEVMNRFHQAQVKCAAVGKRMCTESEWSFACEGPER